MKKRLITLLTPLLLLLLAFIPQTAQAKPVKPAIPLFTTNANFLDWNAGTNYGANVVFSLQWPSLPSGEYYHKYMSVHENTGNGEMQLGIEEVPAYDLDPFGCTDGGNTYDSMFVYAYTIDSDGEPSNKICLPNVVDAGWAFTNPLIGSYMRFRNLGSRDGGCTAYSNLYDSQVMPNYSQLIQWDDRGGNDPVCGLRTSFTDITYYESCSCTVNTGEHEIFGSTWTQNAWANGNQSFINTSVPAPPCGNHDKPGCPFSPGSLTMYWEAGQFPSQGTYGGTLDSCLYKPAPSVCTLGNMPVGVDTGEPVFNSSNTTIVKMQEK